MANILDDIVNPSLLGTSDLQNSFEDVYRAQEWNSKVLCYGTRVRVLPGLTKCVPCSSLWLVPVRFCLLAVEVIWPLTVVHVICNLPSPIVHMGWFYFLLNETIVMWSVYSHPYWADSDMHILNFMTGWFYQPGAYLTSSCFTGGRSSGGGYEAKLIVNFLDLLTPYITFGVIILVIYLLAILKSRREAAVEQAFERLTVRRDQVNKLLSAIYCVDQADAQRGAIANSNARITPKRFVRPPLTRTDLNHKISMIFGPNTETGLCLLKEYELILQRQATLHMRHRLFGCIPLVPQFQWTSLLPILFILYMEYLPKVILSGVMALTCQYTTRKYIGRLLYSQMCGLRIKTVGALLFVKTLTSFLTAVFVIGIPIALLSVNLAAQTPMDVVESLTIGDEDQQSDFMHAHKSRFVLAILRFAHRTMQKTAVFHTRKLVMVGYRSSIWSGFILLRFLMRVFILTAPLATNQFMINVRLGLCCEVIILLATLLARPLVRHSGRILSFIDTLNSVISMLMLITFERIQPWSGDDAVDSAHLVSAKSVSVFKSLIICQLALIFIGFLATLVYEYGKIIALRYYRWRSKIRSTSTTATGRFGFAWMRPINRCCFSIFFNVASKLETRLIHDPSTLDTFISNFGDGEVQATAPTGRASVLEPHKTTRVNARNILKDMKSGLTVLCEGPLACFMQSQLPGFITRFAFQFIRNRRARLQFDVTLRSETLEKFLERYNTSANDQLRVIASGKLTFDDWFGDGPQECENPSCELNWLDLFYEPEALSDFLDLTPLPERRWLKLILRRHIIKTAAEYLDPRAFSYLEIMGSELTLAVEHLEYLPPDLVAIFLCSFISTYQQELGHASRITELNRSCAAMLQKISSNLGGKYHQDHLRKYYQDVAKLAQLKKNCKLTYTSCVDTQVDVLEKIVRENESKLLEAGYSQDILKELACIKTVIGEVERRRQPVDILAYARHDDSDSDDNAGQRRTEATQEQERNEIISQTIIAAMSDEDADAAEAEPASVQNLEKAEKLGFDIDSGLLTRNPAIGRSSSFAQRELGRQPTAELTKARSLNVRFAGMDASLQADPIAADLHARKDGDPRDSFGDENAVAADRDASLGREGSAASEMGSKDPQDIESDDYYAENYGIDADGMIESEEFKVWEPPEWQSHTEM